MPWAESSATTPLYDFVEGLGGGPAFRSWASRVADALSALTIKPPLTPSTPITLLQTSWLASRRSLRKGLLHSDK